MGVSVAIGVGIGAVVGGGAAAIQSGGDWNAIWKGALVGAVGGAVGGWAAPALTGALGGTLGGMAAGGLGGVTAGALGTALSGGNGSDYLRNMAIGGLGGAAVGGASGYFGGGAEGAAAGEGVNPVTGEAVPTGTPTTTPLPEGDLASGLNQSGTGAGAVESTVTGPTAAPTQATTTTPLADTVANLDTSATPSTSTATPAPTIDTTTQPSLASLSQQGQSQAATSMQNLGLSPTPEGVTMPATPETSMAPATQVGNESPKGFWDSFLGSNKSTTGTGKMGLEDYLKLQGKSQLLGGATKLLGAAVTAPETQANRNALMDLYNQQNQQNQFYANQLQNTYTNPQGYLGSPEAAATRSAALQKLVAQNAAAGRRTAGGAMYNQLMQNQLQNLNAYRQGMPRPNYGTAAQVYQNAAQYSPTADIMGGLASGVTPLSLYSIFG